MSDKKRLNFHQECSFNLFLLKINGLYPLSGLFGSSIFNIILIITVNMCHLYIISMDAIDIFHSANNGEINIEVIAGFIGLSGLYLRYVIYWFGRANVLALFQESEKLWMHLKESEKYIVSNSMRLIRILTYVYFGCYGFALLAYVATTLIIILNGTSDKYLMFGKAISLQNPTFGIMLGMQIFASTIMTTSAGYDMIAPFIIAMAVGYFETLHYRLEDLQKQCSFANRHLLLRDVIECIMYHQQINRFCKNINNFTKLLFLVQLISSTYNLSILFLAIVLDTGENLKTFPVIIMQSLQFFLCHWIADILLSANLAVLKSAYMIPSINRKDMKLSKIIHILLMKLQDPVQLRAGGFINLSVECFGHMMSNAVSFFLVLRSFSEH